MEIWKPVRGFKYYEVSSLGNVKCLGHKQFYKNGHSHTYKEHILQISPTKTRLYRYAHLCEDAKQRRVKVCRIVWEAFNGAIPDGMVIDHINTNPSDDRLINLRCVTQKENCNNPLTLIHNKEAHERRRKSRV